MIMLVIIIIIIIMIIIIIIIIIIILKSIIIALFVITDDICRKHKVTKIETVAEEYVACVGVTPSDQEVNNDPGRGHSVLLDGLLKASEEILALQEKVVQGDKVKFKMGLHTGDIVAGVIGSKLPRFRLFGNTINTAARMMQKGEPGTVQFGLETRK
ncbi:gcy-22 [Symbiodinium microadriaticum]|nr:gcy-22 [Symbiodinium microadriaticum]